jgi:proline dehydrogenase
MGLSRKILLAASTNAWLRERAVHTAFVKRSVSRFMPGERAEDALAAAATLRTQGAATILTQLGENLSGAGEAEAVTRHYLDLIDRIDASGLDAQISVKPTQLGFDLDRALCANNLARLTAHAGALRQTMWVDMESAAYVDATLQLVRNASKGPAAVGVALQAYLYRTAEDLESLLPLDVPIRLVKGAYLEPASIAYPKRADVDEQYYRLACRALSARTGHAAVVHLATHDGRLIERIRAYIAEQHISPGAYEFAMLYGIRVPLQRQIARSGRRLRVLISYGEHWFPWYMRRLAERPANLWFVARNVLR